MDKAIQAIDVTAVKAVSKGNSQGNSGETTPFAQLLTPAQAEAGQAQAATTDPAGGNALPQETALAREQSGQPAQAEGPVLPVMQELSNLPGLPVTEVGVAHARQVDGGEAVDAAQASIALVELTTTDATQEKLPVPPVVAGKADAAAVGKPVVDVARGLPTVETAAASDSREAVQKDQRAGVVQMAVSQPVTGTVNNTADDAQAAVRAGVQQAIAAQVSQEGLRQSLSGNRKENPLSARAVTGAAVDTAAAAFTPLLTEASALSASARVPVGEAGWARAVGEQVVWHVSQNIQSANLRLNPQHLGPLEMQLQMDGDKASLAFTSQHAAVRDALESAMPRLREMFAQNGLDIVDVNVSQQNTPGREEQQAGAGRSMTGSAETDSGVEQQLLQSGSATIATGLVDYYI